MLEELRTLVLFAEEGSIQKVARRLPLTQPAVTRQIQRLEDMLAAELLDRRQKPPRLTPTGLEVLARARDILAAVDALKSTTRKAEPEGILRLGLTHGLSDESVAAAVARALDLFPKVSLRLKTAWSAELVDLHRGGQLDIAITLRTDKMQGDGDVIGTERLGIVTASRAGKVPDMTAASWIVSPEPCDARQQLVSALGNGRRLSVAAEIQDAAMQLEWVRRGYGLALMPMRLIQQRMPHGVSRVEPKGLDLSMQVVFLRSPHLHRLEKVADAIADAVRMVLDGES